MTGNILREMDCNYTYMCINLLSQTIDVTLDEKSIESRYLTSAKQSHSYETFKKEDEIRRNVYHEKYELRIYMVEDKLIHKHCGGNTFNVSEMFHT